MNLWPMSINMMFWSLNWKVKRTHCFVKSGCIKPKYNNCSQQFKHLLKRIQVLKGSFKRGSSKLRNLNKKSFKFKAKRMMKLSSDKSKEKLILRNKLKEYENKWKPNPNNSKCICHKLQIRRMNLKESFLTRTDKYLI